jgi:hypothetical protein
MRATYGGLRNLYQAAGHSRRGLRFDLNPEPDYCYYCEGRHCFQRHTVSSQVIVPLDTRQHTAILAIKYGR